MLRGPLKNRAGMNTMQYTTSSSRIVRAGDRDVADYRKRKLHGFAGQLSTNGRGCWFCSNPRSDL